MTPDQFLVFADPLPEPMLLMSGDGHILAGNRAVEERLEVSVSWLKTQRLADVVAESPDEVAHYLRLCCRSRSLVLGAMKLRGNGSEEIECRLEGSVVRPRGEGSDAILMLRVVPKESGTARFVALNQRIDELRTEVQRRQYAEEEARQREEWLRVTLVSIGDGVICTDCFGRVTMLNPVAEALTGWTQEEARGQLLESVFVIHNQQSQLPVENPVEKVLRDGVVVGLGNHTILIAKDGTQRPIDDSAAPIRDKAAGIIGVVLIFRDITERDRSEQHRNTRLAATHALNEAVGSDDATSGILRAVCENLGWDVGFYWAVNPSGESLVCTQGWHKPTLPVAAFEEASFSLLFEKEAGFPGRVWSTGKPLWLLDVMDHAEFPRAASAAKYDLHSAFACPVFVGDRILGVFEFFTRRFREPDADLLEMMGSIAANFGQFLERKLAEEQVRESERELADFFDNATVGLHWVGPDGTVLKANRSELDMLGYSREEYVGRSISDFHADQDAICDILNRLQKGEQLREYPARLCCRDGSIKDVLIDSSVLFKQGQFVHTRCLTRDVTDRKRADSILAAQKRVLELLVQDVALADVLDALCQTIESQSHNTLIATVLLLDEDGQRLRSVAGHRTPDNYARAIDGVVIGPSVGSCGTAAYRGQQVVVCDIASDPLWSNYKELALEHGFKACWSTPIVSSVGKVLGTFAVYSPVPRGPSAAELQLVDVLTRTAGVAIERRRGEQEVRFQARLLDTVGQAAIVTDRDGEIIYWNRFAETLYGWQKQEALGRNFAQLVVAPEEGELAAEIMDRLRAGEVWAGEFLVRRRDGTTFVAFVTDTPLLDEQGDVDAIIGISVDISDRKRLESSLRLLADASAALADLVDYQSTLQKVAALSVPHFADWCAVDITQPEGTLRRLAVAHVDEEKLHLAKELDERYPPRSDVAYGAYHVLRTGRTEMMEEIPDKLLVELAVDQEHLRFLRELGLKSYMCVPLLARGKTLGVMTFVSAESGRSYTAADLAFGEELARRSAVAIENAQLYRELREADRRKDEFLATLAHELRNPLAPIRNGLQVMRLSGSEDGIVAEARCMMERQLNQMIRLVDDLLDVSRITRDKLELKKQPVELATVVRSAVETSRPLIEQYGHTISVVLPPTPIYLDADLTRLAQVFSNLLNNSAKYTPAGGHIWLDAESFENEVAVRVRDNGMGIPADSLPGIFQIFSQVERNMEMAQGGLGIGLTLVRRLVEMHGGTVEAHSQGAGQGSQFTVRLPVVELSQIVPQSLTTADGLAEKRRILIVDDNQDAAKSLDMMLKLMGHDTHLAHDGLAAVQAASDFRPQIILLDIGLPKLNGYDACRRIRQQSWSDCMLIVALTGWGQEEDRRRSKEAGFDYHMVKPVELAALGKLLAAPPGRSPILEQSHHTKTSLRVLVVDDMRDAVHMLRTLLSAAGHEVRTASDGPTALAVALDFQPEVVLLDISLPGLSGLEVAQRIRQQPELKDIVLVAMTGYGDDEDRRRSLQAGFDHHLVKPADIRVVKEVLATVKVNTK